ncbi:VOC family protein [Microbaculum sp. FT89]|uniref:VOC family protein n=1 Tax=Microbaculum sp. FT89 TaxID=3447298 RepID=UPI003F53C932
MARGIDHLVLAVHGLDRARSVYERLGFTVTPKAQHPFGTENHLVQLDGCFLELLGITDPDLFPVPEPGQFSFPRFNFRFLEQFEGMSMLVLDSSDAVADAKAFAEAGIQAYMPFAFGRDAQLPDGSLARVGFTLAFASDPSAPEAAFFTCQQLAPEHFWKTDYQRHANTAKTVLEVVMIAETPADHHMFYEAFVGTREVRATSMGLTVETARGRIRIETPAAVAATWGDAVPVADYRSPRFAAYVIGVERLEAAADCLERAGILFETRGDRLIVPASETLGAAVGFEAVRA